MIHLHALLWRSRANGPGLRTVIWCQGCTLACPGCFNPQTHPPGPSNLVKEEELVRQIIEQQNSVEGITISGGEPFQQGEALLQVVKDVRRLTELSTIVFSGYTESEIRSVPLWCEVLDHIDVLVAGRYVAQEHVGSGLIGSANQKIHRLTDRYTLEDLQQTPVSEVYVDGEGVMTVSGMVPLRGIS